MQDAELHDLYIDAAGKLWRVIAICGEPTVHMQEVETSTPESPVRKLGGVSGHMWSGFKRIHRPEKPKPPEQPKNLVTRDWHYDSQGYCDNPGRGY